MTSLKTSAPFLSRAFRCARCKVGPNYKRPATTVPDQYRGVAPSASQQRRASPSPTCSGPRCTQDEVLQGLIKEALTNNYDMRIAATRVLAGEREPGNHPGQPVPNSEWLGRSFNERAQLTNLHPTSAPTFDTLATVAELHRRFLGTVPSRHRSRSGELAGHAIRTRGGSELADHFGCDQLLPACGSTTNSSSSRRRPSTPTTKS